MLLVCNSMIVCNNLVGWREMSASLFAFWIKNDISSSGTWCVHTINIQVTELSFDWFSIENLPKYTLLRCYVLRVRIKIQHALYIQELHKFHGDSSETGTCICKTSVYFFYQRTVILMHGHKYLETPKYLLRRLKSPYT